jgi:hypothetical protein
MSTLRDMENGMKNRRSDRAESEVPYLKQKAVNAYMTLSYITLL